MNTERSLAEEITEGFDALKRIRELESDNAELKAYNTTLHGIEHDLEMKVSKLQAEIAELKNARDYWCLQYKDVFNKLEAMEDKLMLAKQSLEIVEGWTKND